MRRYPSPSPPAVGDICWEWIDEVGRTLALSHREPHRSKKGQLSSSREAIGPIHWVPWNTSIPRGPSVGSCDAYLDTREVFNILMFLIDDLVQTFTIDLCRFFYFFGKEPCLKWWWSVRSSHCLEMRVWGANLFFIDPHGHFFLEKVTVTGRIFGR